MRVLGGHQVAPLELERRIQERCQLPDRDRIVLRQLLHRPADRRPGREHAGDRVRHLERDPVEAERVADPDAHVVQQRVGRKRLLEPRRHPQQLVQRDLVVLARNVLLGALERERRVVGDRRQHLQLGRPGPAARERLAHRDDAQHVPGGVEQRHEQLVVGVPVAGIVAGRPCRHVPASDVVRPVERAVRDQVRPAVLEAVVEQRRPGLPGQRVSQQLLTRLHASMDGGHLEVVPGRPVQVDHDRAVAERHADRACDRLQHAAGVGLVTDQPRHLEQASKTGSSSRILGCHGVPETPGGLPTRVIAGCTTFCRVNAADV